MTQSGETPSETSDWVAGETQGVGLAFDGCGLSTNPKRIGEVMGTADGGEVESKIRHWVLHKNNTGGL